MIEKLGKDYNKCSSLLSLGGGGNRIGKSRRNQIVGPLVVQNVIFSSNSLFAQFIQIYVWISMIIGLMRISFN